MNHLKSENLKILARRLKTPFAEIDILAGHQSQIWCVYEVKTFNEAFQKQVLSLKQKQRLQRACIYLSEKFQVTVILKLALVEKNQKVIFVPME